jgi:3-deoxy-D-manno-octulosonic-acid transferase
MWKRGGYRKNLKYRFGLCPKIEKSTKKRIWIQAVSVGEVKAVGQLIDRFIADGRFEVVLTTTSSTGYAIAEKLYADKVLFLGLFPWDFFPFSSLAWKRISPDIIILVEAEIWPEHLHQAHRRGVPVYLVNARMSDLSFARYSRCKVIFRMLFSRITKILAQSSDAFNRFTKLGVDKNRIVISENIKFDYDLPEIDAASKNKLKLELGFSEDSFVLLGSSTWPGEEELLIKCLLAARKKTKQDWRLLLVPRHAERRSEIIEYLKKSKFSWHQRSLGMAPKRTDICLADTTGELAQLTGAADLAFIGKSLFDNDGGQSPLEAAAYGVPIVYGNRMTNFRAVCESLESIGGAIVTEDAASTQNALLTLASDTRRRTRLSKILSEWYHGNRGATEYTYRTIIGDVFRGEQAKDHQ